MKCPLELNARAAETFVDRGMIGVRLDDGREIRFPAEKNRRLRNASPAQLANMEIICNGTGIHWPDLNEDLSIIGILEGRFGQE
jgi:hypothetical protein